MKKLIAFAFVVFAANFVIANPAAAGNCTTDTACDVSRIQSSRSDYVGPLARTTQDMVCLSVIAYEPTSLVLTDGDQRNRAVVEGKILTSWRVQEDQWHPWVRDSKYVAREICIPRAMLRIGNNPSAGFRPSLTLCNGEYLDEPQRNRSVWRRSEGAPQYLWRERRLPETDPASLLGSRESAKYGL